MRPPPPDERPPPGAERPPLDGRDGIIIGLGRGPGPDVRDPESGDGRGPPAPGAPERGDEDRGGAPDCPDCPPRDPAGRGGRDFGAPIPVLVELNGLLPGRGPGAGRRGPAGAGRGGAGLGGPGRGPPWAGAASPARFRSSARSGEGSGRGGSESDGLGGCGMGRGCGGPDSGRPSVGFSTTGSAPARPSAVSPTGRAGAFTACAVSVAFDARGFDGAANASLSLRTTGASTVEDADRTNSPISWSLAMTTLLSTPNSLASSYTRTFATSLPTSVRGVLRTVASLPYSSLRAHRVLIAISTRLRLEAVSTVSYVSSDAVLRVRTLGRPGVQVASEHAHVERPRQAKRPREHPTALCKPETPQVGMQRSTPSGQPPAGIGDDDALDHHKV